MIKSQEMHTNYTIAWSDYLLSYVKKAICDTVEYYEGFLIEIDFGFINIKYTIVIKQYNVECHVTSVETLIVIFDVLVFS